MAKKKFAKHTMIVSSRKPKIVGEKKLSKASYQQSFIHHPRNAIFAYHWEKEARNYFFPENKERETHQYQINISNKLHTINH